MKRNASYLSKRLLLPLSIWLLCGGNNLIAQEAEDKPGLSITCSIKNGRRLETDAYAVSNVERIQLVLTLSNPHRLNLRHPSLWPRQDSEGKILAPPHAFRGGKKAFRFRSRGCRDKSSGHRSKWEIR